MSFISEALNRVLPSPTIGISQKARVMALGGRKIISLSAGEPDFDTPQNIKNAANEAIKLGKTKYTNTSGIIELREAIAAKFKRDNGLNILPENCFVATGGKQIIFNALLASLNKGDEVIIPSPYWVSYPEIVRLCDAKPVFVKANISTGFKIDAKMLEAAITPKTKWLMLNSPSNPTGAIYSRDELKKLADVLKNHPNIWVLSDDIYEQLVYDDAKFATIAQVAPELQNRTLTMNGFSKSHAMTGWRLGYCTAPNLLIKAMSKLQSQSTGAPCSIAQWAGVEALNGSQDFLLDWQKEFEKRRNFVVEQVNQIDGINCLTPGGAFYVFPSIKNLLGKVSKGGQLLRTDEDFVSAFLEENGVALVHGSAFGMEGHIRISYAASMSDLKDALILLSQFCVELK